MRKYGGKGEREGPQKRIAPLRLVVAKCKRKKQLAMCFAKLTIALSDVISLLFHANDVLFSDQWINIHDKRRCHAGLVANCTASSQSTSPNTHSREAFLHILSITLYFSMVL